MPLPDSSSLWEKMSTLNGKDVGEFLGGNIKGLTNFCAVRISYALMKCGHPIKINSDYKDNAGNKYIIKTKTMEGYLNDNYQGSSGVESIKNESGIVYFRECGFSDATGHMEIVINGKCVGKDYSEQAKSIRIWRC